MAARIAHPNSGHDYSPTVVRGARTDILRFAVRRPDFHSVWWRRCARDAQPVAGQ